MMSARKSMVRVFLILIFGLGSACSPTSPSTLISREQAIDLARQRIDFEPKSISAETNTFHGNPVWTITFATADPTNLSPGQFAKLNVDRKTGEVAWISIS
jgi:hypothetical protein